MRRGFVDIPVGDYKLSHLSEHPNLHVHGAPRVRFSQTDGQDLCVSKSLASALDALAWFSKRGITHRCVWDFLLARWCCRSFWEGNALCQDCASNVDHMEMCETASGIRLANGPQRTNHLVGGFNASDGNCSHAVTVHGGFIYNANELVAIPLCQEALDYCTSTPTEKSMFINFCRISLFYYEGRRQEKVKRMSLFDQTEIVEKKRKFVLQTILK